MLWPIRWAVRPAVVIVSICRLSFSRCSLGAPRTESYESAWASNPISRSACASQLMDHPPIHKPCTSTTLWRPSVDFDTATRGDADAAGAALQLGRRCGQATRLGRERLRSGEPGTYVDLP